MDNLFFLSMLAGLKTSRYFHEISFLTQGGRSALHLQLKLTLRVCDSSNWLSTNTLESVLPSLPASLAHLKSRCKIQNSFQSQKNSSVAALLSRKYTNVHDYKCIFLLLMYVCVCMFSHYNLK